MAWPRRHPPTTTSFLLLKQQGLPHEASNLLDRCVELLVPDLDSRSIFVMIKWQQYESQCKYVFFGIKGPVWVCVPLAPLAASAPRGYAVPGGHPWIGLKLSSHCGAVASEEPEPAGVSASRQMCCLPAN